MNSMRTVVGAIAAFALSIVSSPQTAKADCINRCGVTVISPEGDIVGEDKGNVFRNTTPAAPPVDHNDNPDSEFANRVDAAVTFGLTCELPLCEKCGKPDYGQDYQRIIFALLEAGAKETGPTKPRLDQAITLLRAIKKSDIKPIGTDSPAAGVCEVPVVGGLLAKLINVFSNAARDGDGDTAMIGFINILYRYGPPPGKNILPSDVYENLLSIIDLSRGPGSVEHLSFGLNGEVVCPSVCAAPVNPYAIGCTAICLLAAEAARVVVPETENHINMIYAAQYLANQLWFKKTSDPKYDNARNGYRAVLINRLNSFVRNDFIEYNSHNYQDFDMYGLLSLASYAVDPAVKAAARRTLDYISAKVAVSSNDARRTVPFRRRNEGGHVCGQLIEQDCADPQTAFYMMLAGNWDLLLVNPPVRGKPDVPRQAPWSYGPAYLWAATTDYKMPWQIRDLLVDRSHRRFYQFFHNCRTLETDGFQECIEELYSSSPSYLVSAGGHGAHYAYTAEVPFPFSVIPFFGINEGRTGLLSASHPGDTIDLGFAPPTTVMPTRDLTAREEMIRFDPSLCVGPNFACGTNPKLGICGPGVPAPCATVTAGDTRGTYKQVDGPISKPAAGESSWTFIEYVSPKSGATLEGTYGFYAAVYQQDGFGFVELYDTSVVPKTFATLGDFKTAVLANNPGPTFSPTDPNTYKMVDGKTIQFSVGEGRIIAIDGNPPYDPNRTSGDVINNDGTGVVTIKNPAFPNDVLTLDASAPAGHPQITIPGPLTFSDTCVGSVSFTTLNICNPGNGTDDLFVYNILSLTNTQFEVTEPTSGYPTTVGSNFCFPFSARFAPIMTGAISSKLTISSSDPIVPELKLAVKGNGIQQNIATVISNSGNFGNVCIGSFTDLDLTISNSGGCTLTVSNIGSSSPAFTVAGTVSFPLTVQAGGSVSVPIRFHPSVLGETSGDITVATNDPETPNAVVHVVGNAPPPVLNATIGNLGNFGNVCAGTQKDLTLQVVNQGLCSLTISSINTNGGVSFALPSVTTFPLVLGQDGRVDLPIRFQPPAYGSPNYITCSDTVPQTANVVIHSDDPQYPDPTGFVRSVSAIEGCPQLVLSPQNLTGAFAFPATVSDPEGTRGCFTDRQITVTNAGICPLTMVSLATSNGVDEKELPLPAAPLEFTVMQPTTPVTIDPGASPVPITIRFRPLILPDQSNSGPDQQTGFLTIVSNDPVPAHNGAGLCGEPTYQSGARVLVVNTANQPVASVASITIASKGLTPPFSQTLRPAPLQSVQNICGKTIQYHLDTETLRPAGTTGNNPKGSYTVSAKNGSTQANVSFSLGQCEMEDITLQIR